MAIWITFLPVVIFAFMIACLPVVIVCSRKCCQQKAAVARKKLEVIQRRSEFPGKLRNAIDEWKNENPENFVWKI